MVKKRRLVGLGLAVGLAAALLVGAVGASAKPKQQVTLKLLASAPSKPGHDVIIANFERVYPNIRVEATYVDSTAFNSLLLTQLQAGNEPDLFFTSLGGASNVSVFPLAAQGRLLDLSGSPWVKRVLPDARRYSSRQHKIYALPLGYNLQGLMYNKDLFASLGLKEPTTFNELLALCGKIRAAGKIPIAAGFAGISAQVNLSLQMMTQFVYSQDKDWTLHRIQKKVTFAGSPDWQQALQAFVQMQDANCFQPAPAATTAQTQYAMMARGDAVMMPASSQEGAVLQSINPNFKWACSLSRPTRRPTRSSLPAPGRLTSSRARGRSIRRKRRRSSTSSPARSRPACSQRCRA